MKKKTTQNYQLIRRDEHLLVQREKHLGIIKLVFIFVLKNLRFMVSVAAGDKKTPAHTNGGAVVMDPAIL